MIPVDPTTDTPPIVRANLCFIRRGDELLLIRKKRGLGAGKINGPGGKIDPGETAMQSAVRETYEELGVTAIALRQVGDLSFEFRDGLRLHCAVFFTDEFEGEARETDEAIPLWTKIDAIPYDEMWEDDRYWLPLVIAGKHFRARFTFDGERMIEKQIELVADDEELNDTPSERTR